MDLVLIFYLVINLHGTFMLGSFNVITHFKFLIFDNEHVFQDDDRVFLR